MFAVIVPATFFGHGRTTWRIINYVTSVWTRLTHSKRQWAEFLLLSLSLFFFMAQITVRLFLLSFIFIVQRPMLCGCCCCFLPATLPFVRYLKHLVVCTHTHSRAITTIISSLHLSHCLLCSSAFCSAFCAYRAGIKKMSALLLRCAQISKPKNSLWQWAKKYCKFQLQIV